MAYPVIQLLPLKRVRDLFDLGRALLPRRGHGRRDLRKRSFEIGFAALCLSRGLVGLELGNVVAGSCSSLGIGWAHTSRRPRGDTLSIGSSSLCAHQRAFHGLEERIRRTWWAGRTSRHASFEFGGPRRLRDGRFTHRTLLLVHLSRSVEPAVGEAWEEHPAVPAARDSGTVRRRTAVREPCHADWGRRATSSVIGAAIVGSQKS